MAAKLPTKFKYEHTLWQQGVMRVAGVDEAGRGPLAGPVVAAAAILPQRWAETRLPKELRGLNDSKQLTVEQREQFFAFLTTCGEVEYGVAEVSVEMIDQINILQATHRAMNEALGKLNPLPPHALVDGLRVKTLCVEQTAIVEGDAKSYSIAAASVLAKVTRDRLMVEYHSRFPQYGFAKHKGYGTPQHLEAIGKHGACPIHRRTFAPFRPRELELSLITD